MSKKRDDLELTSMNDEQASNLFSTANFKSTNRNLLSQLHTRHQTVYNLPPKSLDVSTFKLPEDIAKKIDNIFLPPPPSTSLAHSSYIPPPDNSADTSMESSMIPPQKEELEDNNSMPRFEINLETVDNYFGFRDKFTQIELLNQMMHNQGCRSLEQFCMNAIPDQNIFDEDAILESLKSFLDGFTSTVHSNAKDFIDMINDRISVLDNVAENLNEFQAEITKVKGTSTYMSIEDLRQDLPPMKEPIQYDPGPEQPTSIYIFPAESPLNVGSLEKLGAIAENSDPSTFIKRNSLTSIMSTPNDFFSQPISYTSNNDPFATQDVKAAQHRFCPEFFGSVSGTDDTPTTGSNLRTHAFNSRYLSKQNFASFKSHGLQSTVRTSTNSSNSGSSKQYYNHDMPQVQSTSIPPYSPESVAPPPPSTKPMTVDMLLSRLGADGEVLKKFIKVKAPVNRVSFSVEENIQSPLAFAANDNSNENDDEDIPPAPELILPDRD
ncbi:hypothetical protein TVAG_103500 [Trichomonas vaginalis G3]|uniref:Uncharacterized protein n=1 Tax=Trichomonas vaginalis (strain ATCC PRA-98 / G3) TaxID=412133 RepID=A2EKR1_TRIV3|nr:hypothetical protein TVAGG3_0931110 [Trichomonas vaginalis G3]EAY06800.1 hypothetical protein TVAG_103500 [Trichomonas vaginalis G3]KAI5485840.1 hypothetical protein TVAGG3_0931110 [Trichomonas vaginalis G3]|eukprot:XP_001319023.1 hypothetical protein [Trichomonas vaginalis G3]